MVAAAVVRQIAQFAAVGANVPQNKSSKEQKFLGTFVLGIRSWEREFQGAKVLDVSFYFLELSFPGAKVQRNEKSVMELREHSRTRNTRKINS